MYDEIIKSLRQAYDTSAVERDKASRGSWRIRERHKFLELLAKEKRSTLLEIGAGPGKDSKFFHDNGLQVIATDLSPQMVALCREKGLEAYTMDFKNLDFPTESFDAVYAFNSLLHVPKQDLQAVLVTLQKLLKPSGLFFVAVWGGKESEGVWEDDRQRPKRFFSFFTDEELKKTVSSFFDIYDFEALMMPDSDEGLHIQRLILRKT